MEAGKKEKKIYSEKQVEKYVEETIKDIEYYQRREDSEFWDFVRYYTEDDKNLTAV